ATPLQHDQASRLNRIQAASTGGVRACIRRVAGCAPTTGFAGHAGATANLKLTFHLDHSAGADQFLLLVTWLAYGQPPDHYQVPFSSNEACEAARLQLIKDAERIGQSMIERASAQDRQIGSNNKTSLVMAAISNAPYVSAVCVQPSAG